MLPAKKPGALKYAPAILAQLANLDAAGTGAQFYQRPAHAYFPPQLARAYVTLHAYFMGCLDVPRAAPRDQVECRLRREDHTNASGAAMQPPVAGGITLSGDAAAACAHLGPALHAFDLYVA